MGSVVQGGAVSPLSGKVTLRHGSRLFHIGTWALAQAVGQRFTSILANAAGPCRHTVTSRGSWTRLTSRLRGLGDTSIGPSLNKARP